MCDNQGYPTKFEPFWYYETIAPKKLIVSIRGSGKILRNVYDECLNNFIIKSQSDTGGGVQ